LKTIIAFTPSIVIRRLDGPKHCIRTQVIVMPIIGDGFLAD
jgi:hypothetical protein